MDCLVGHVRHRDEVLHVEDGPGHPSKVFGRERVKVVDYRACVYLSARYRQVAAPVPYEDGVAYRPPFGRRVEQLVQISESAEGPFRHPGSEPQVSVALLEGSEFDQLAIGQPHRWSRSRASSPRRPRGRAPRSSPRTRSPSSSPRAAPSRS